MAGIEARGLRKSFGNTIALDGVNLRVEAGRILGLIGPNGAGKTTALKAILGLTRSRRAQGARPRSVDRARRADARRLLHRRRGGAAALAAGSQALDFVAGVHPRFDRAKAEAIPRQHRDQAATSKVSSYPRAWSRSCIWRW